MFSVIKCGVGGRGCKISIKFLSRRVGDLCKLELSPCKGLSKEWMTPVLMKQRKCLQQREEVAGFVAGTP